MYIQSVKAWTDVGYLEESLSVPFQKQLKLQYTWKVENVHPSPSALFSLLKLLIDGKDGRTLDNYLNTKYLEIKIDDFGYLLYGWVDDVVISSKRTVGIFWHIDCWRTYFHKCQYKGWVKRRSPSLTDPYHIFPAFSNHGCLEDIVLANQRKGIAWVILLYLEGDSLYGSATQAAVNSIPGSSSVKTIARTAVELLKGIFNSITVASRTGRQPTSEDGNIGASISFVPDFDVVRCLTFPISVNASEQIYFRSDTQIGGVFDSPTYTEVINGTVSRVLGIKPGNLISCHVSPMCPLKDVSGFYDDGTSDGIPLVIHRQDSNIVVPDFVGLKQMIVKLDSRVDMGYLKIKGFGVRNVGSIKEGCTEIKNILATYYAGYYLLDPIKYVEGNDVYIVNVSKTHFKCNGYMLISLRQVLDLTYPSWKQYHDLNISHLVQYKDGKYSSRLFQILPLPKTIDDLPTWKLKKDGTSYTWHIELDEKQYFSDMCNSRGHNYNIHHIDISHDMVRVFEKDGSFLRGRSIHEVMLDSIYVGIWPGEDWPDDVDFKAGGLQINAFDVGGNFTMHMFRSLSTMQGRAAIQSRTMTWPILKGSLDKEYYTDDYHDLVLIGPNGNVLHKFKTGVRISNYTYQTVTSGSSSFIKLRFETNNPYAMASECEINVPLSPMTAFCEYSNPWKYLTEDSQRFVRYMIEDEKISKGIKLEDDNIALGYKKQDEGLMNTLGRAASDVASDVVKVVTNAVGKISQDPIKYTPLGGIIGPAVEAIGNAINGGKSGSSRGGSMFDIDIRKLLNVPEYKPARDVAQALVEGPAFPTPQTYRDDEKALRKAQRDYEKEFREIERSIGGYNIDPPATSCLSIGDTSWIHELGLLRLVYITKDDYSVDVYHNTSEMLGIDVNEYHDDYTTIQPGPLKVDPVRVLGKDVPKYALDYIKSRLETGVYVDEKL